jgi:hypothetical protein
MRNADSRDSVDLRFALCQQLPVAGMQAMLGFSGQQ